MTGAIWLAQLSQYPLLAYVGRRNFIRYENQHIRRISNIAWLIIYIELISGLLLVFFTPDGVPAYTAKLGFLLIAVIWSATWFIQYPIHKKLAHGFDKTLHRKLVNTNWLRTISWTLRALIWTLALSILL
ncbi:MAG: hypothetical protein A2920_02035 [Candidatus Zambryskibacteria bacterium RIFCSPLOWO2_01_FULL_43_17]|uniref:DUF4149 domain-containing protein n=1 Tax=Candidatus Zambryskibacteria bacterium RIFCSPLOWO2_01_FULL_43_17 TaxID=1802760 RepID=A0A1G2U5A7_9BACT|nr:MAG: hypothetical protein A2920_02035 [Candidatus Zambryskibacteria bacterium RIFCSPLOWO2_01_FULL_43_17]